MFREMRRIKKKLTQEEAVQVLKDASRAVLSVTGEDGYPYGVPVNFLYEAGHIYFHTAKEGMKMDCMRTHPKVCLTAWDAGYKLPGDWAWTLHSVVVFGHVHFIDEEKEKIRLLTDLARKYFPNEEEIMETLQRSKNGCLIGCIDIDHITGKKIHEK